MIDRQADPRTHDTIIFELLESRQGAADARVVGRAIFRGGRATVEAPEGVRVAVEELLAHAFVDRVQADERPRGYRRSGRGVVDMLVPGMAEHFIARLRGLWLSYPDGSVITAREAGASHGSTAVELPDVIDPGSSVTDPTTRRTTLTGADQTLGTRPLALGHPPESGIRPVGETMPSGSDVVGRTDCGWLV